MNRWLRIRWKGPLMSLGGARIDGFAQQMPIPSASVVAGMLGAALGYRRGDRGLTELADALRYGVVVHRPGTPLVDYQTADLDAIGREAVAVDGYGRLHLFRREGSVVDERAQQWRPLLADADMTVVGAVAGMDAETLLNALRDPVFPLYLGRVSCPPSRPVGEGTVEADTLDLALDSVQAEVGGVSYKPVETLVDGLVVSVPSRGRAAALFSIQ